MGDGDIDFSNAGLAERVEDAGVTDREDSIAETPESSEVAPIGKSHEDGGDDTPVDDADGAGGDVDAEPDPEPQPEPEAPETATNEWQVRYDEATKVIGRQGQELGELRKMFEQIQQQQAQPATPELATWQPTTQDELLDGAADLNFAEAAFVFARDNAPNLLPDVLAEVRVHDPAAAERMQLEYIETRMQASLAPVTQRIAKADTDGLTAAVVAQYGQQVDGWDDIKNEVADIIEEEGWLVGDGSPEAVQRGLRAATRMAQQARAVAATHAQAQATAQGLQQRQQAAVETGTNGAAPVVEDQTPADAIRAGIFAQDKIRRELF